MKAILINLFILFSSLNFVIAQNDHIIAGVYDSTMSHFVIDSTLMFFTVGYFATSINLDLDQNYEVDFRFESYCYNGATNIFGNLLFKPFNGNEVIYYSIDTVNNYKVVEPFNYGELINVSCSFNIAPALLYNYEPSELILYEMDAWVDIGPKYLGFRMNINDSIVYGWIKLEVYSDGYPLYLKIYDYALSDIIGVDSVTDDTISRYTSIYPNPVHDILYIQVPHNSNTAYVNIYDIRGKLYLHKTLETSGWNSIYINNLSSGTYIINVQTDLGIFNSKIIKQ